MNESKIAVRYARAFFLLATEKNNLDKVRDDLTLVAAALNENVNFKTFLFSPVTKPSVRVKVVNEVFGNHIDSITKNFLLLLVNNNRFHYIDEVVVVFSTVYRKHKGIKSANIAAAYPVSEKLKQTFLNVLKSVYKAEIELTSTTDTNLIGGFVLTVEDQQYDASIASQINKLKASLK